MLFISFGEELSRRGIEHMEQKTWELCMVDITQDLPPTPSSYHYIYMINPKSNSSKEKMKLSNWP